MGNKYCNSIKRVLTSNYGMPNVLGKDVLGTPTVKEIEAEDNVIALLQLQDIPVESSTVKLASTFYDPGSNVNLVLKQFTKRPGGRADWSSKRYKQLGVELRRGKPKPTTSPWSTERAQSTTC